jgi:NET1-associated nuclear protein 1 (U3 small nucleolar RNA-associated protein 17)
VHGLRPHPGLPQQQQQAKQQQQQQQPDQEPEKEVLRTLPGSPLAMQPGTGLVVLAGTHSVLQFYDVLRDTHVDKLQLSQRSMVSLAEEDAAAMGGVYGAAHEPTVSAVAFGCNGAAMATVEARPSPAGGGGLRYSLKFWDKTGQGGAEEPAGASYGRPYRLNTLADDPHRSSAGSGAVSCLAFHPASDLAVSTSEAGDFRLWERRRPQRQQQQQQQAHMQQKTWRCAAVGSYRGEPMRAAAFSADGSLLAVGAGAAVTLWETRTAALLGVLATPVAPSSQLAVSSGASAGENITSLAFVSGTSFLVAGTGSSLTVYDVVTRGVEWSAGLQVGCVVSDPGSSNWAVTVGAEGRRTAVLVFRGAGTTPEASWAVRASKGASSSSAAGPQLGFSLPGTPLRAAAASTQGPAPLVVLSPQREYAVIGAAVAQPGSDGGMRHRAGQPMQVGGYEAMYGKLRASESAGGQNAMEGAEVVYHPTRLGASLLDVESHLLPPLSTLCPAFLELFVKEEEGPAAG